jgi:hypothetical protein
MALDTGVNAALGASNYTPFLQGAMQGAQMQAQGAQNIGQGLANLGSSAGQTLLNIGEQKKQNQQLEGSIKAVENFLTSSKQTAEMVSPGMGKNIDNVIQQMHDQNVPLSQRAAIAQQTRQHFGDVLNYGFKGKELADQEKQNQYAAYLQQGNGTVPSPVDINQFTATQRMGGQGIYQANAKNAAEINDINAQAAMRKNPPLTYTKITKMINGQPMEQSYDQFGRPAGDAIPIKNPNVTPIKTLENIDGINYNVEKTSDGKLISKTPILPPGYQLAPDKKGVIPIPGSLADVNVIGKKNALINEYEQNKQRIDGLRGTLASAKAIADDALLLVNDGVGGAVSGNYPAISSMLSNKFNTLNNHYDALKAMLETTKIAQMGGFTGKLRTTALPRSAQYLSLLYNSVSPLNIKAPTGKDSTQAKNLEQVLSHIEELKKQLDEGDAFLQKNNPYSDDLKDFSPDAQKYFRK